MQFVRMRHKTILLQLKLPKSVPGRKKLILFFAKSSTFLLGTGLQYPEICIASWAPKQPGCTLNSSTPQLLHFFLTP